MIILTSLTKSKIADKIQYDRYLKKGAFEANPQITMAVNKIV